MYFLGRFSTGSVTIAFSLRIVIKFIYLKKKKKKKKKALKSQNGGCTGIDVVVSVLVVATEAMWLSETLSLLLSISLQVDLDDLRWNLDCLF
jgi:hypothetical protein